MKKSLFYLIFISTLYIPEISYADSGLGRAFSGALKAMADGRLDDIRRQEEFEYQKQLILYQQQLEYQRQRQSQERINQEIRDAEIVSEKERAAAEILAKRRQEIAIKEAEESEAIQILTLYNKALAGELSLSESQLSRAIPNWKNIVKSNNFSSWFFLQPEEIRILASSNTSSDAIKLIKLYQKSR